MRAEDPCCARWHERTWFRQWSLPYLRRYVAEADRVWRQKNAESAVGTFWNSRRGARRLHRGRCDDARSDRVAGVCLERASRTYWTALATSTAAILCEEPAWREHARILLRDIFSRPAGGFVICSGERSREVSWPPCLRAGHQDSRHIDGNSGAFREVMGESETRCWKSWTFEIRKLHTVAETISSTLSVLHATAEPFWMAVYRSERSK